ncbi:hypothetical protein DSECCO2_587660 [anaerobic digester metagenome]
MLETHRIAPEGLGVDAIVHIAHQQAEPGIVVDVALHRSLDWRAVFYVILNPAFAMSHVLDLVIDLSPAKCYFLPGAIGVIAMFVDVAIVTFIIEIVHAIMLKDEEAVIDRINLSAFDDLGISPECHVILLPGIDIDIAQIHRAAYGVEVGGIFQSAGSCPDLTGFIHTGDECDEIHVNLAGDTKGIAGQYVTFHHFTVYRIKEQ